MYLLSLATVMLYNTQNFIGIQYNSRHLLFTNLRCGVHLDNSAVLAELSHLSGAQQSVGWSRIASARKTGMTHFCSASPPPVGWLENILVVDGRDAITQVETPSIFFNALVCHISEHAIGWSKSHFWTWEQGEEYQYFASWVEMCRFHGEWHR